MVEYSDISPYFVEDRIKLLKEAGGMSLPVKLEYYSLLGGNPAKERGMSVLEKALGLGTTEWNQPLVSSNTQSGNASDKEGAPIKDGDDLSDEGVATRDKK